MNQEKSVYITFIMENRGIYLEQKLFQDKYMISIQSYKKENKKKNPLLYAQTIYQVISNYKYYPFKAVIMN